MALFCQDKRKNGELTFLRLLDAGAHELFQAPEGLKIKLEILGEGVGDEPGVTADYLLV